ncbi:cyclic nucleotide-binding-like protein [Pisolithus marmoratus]|nr:cyclic nucleotide-binding-like protein [Pisolithus marmoratus]
MALQSTFESLIADLTRDVHRAQPRDALQFCANWFNLRLEEQRTRMRDVLGQLVQRGRPSIHELPEELYTDSPLYLASRNSTPTPVSSFARRPSTLPTNSSSRPFGTLNVPGNALLSGDCNGVGVGNTPDFSSFSFEPREVPPTSPHSTDPNSFARFDLGHTSRSSFPVSGIANDYLQAHASTMSRRASVSAEPIDVENGNDDPPPVFPKTPEQLRRIKASIANNFIFRDLDEEQETGVLNAMKEVHVKKDEVVIRQGDVGDYFYVVESGLFYCYIHPEPLPPTWPPADAPSSTKLAHPGYHPVYGRKVMECKPGSSFGELALMYGHPRAATVQAIEPSTVWVLDRITFRTIILKAAYRRRTMYEHFVSTVPLLSSLEPVERSKIADTLYSRVYQDGEPVVSQGEMGDTFFFIEEGEAVVTKIQTFAEGERREVTVGHLKKGDYFGELSLLRLEPRAATVSAVNRSDPSQAKLKVAALDAHAFTRLLGPLRDLMERRAGENYGIITRATH